MGRFGLFSGRKKQPIEPMQDISTSKAHRVLGATPLDNDLPTSRDGAFNDISPISLGDDASTGSGVGRNNTRISILGLGTRHSDVHSNRSSNVNARSSVAWSEWSDFVALRLGLEGAKAEPKAAFISSRAAQSPINVPRQSVITSQEPISPASAALTFADQYRKKSIASGVSTGRGSIYTSREPSNDHVRADRELSVSDKEMSLTRTFSTISSMYEKPSMAAAPSKALKLLDMDGAYNSPALTRKASGHVGREDFHHAVDDESRPTTPHSRRKLQKRRTKELLRPSTAKSLQPEAPAVGAPNPRLAREQPSLYDHYEQMSWRHAVKQMSAPNLRGISDETLNPDRRMKRNVPFPGMGDQTSHTALSSPTSKRAASATRLPTAKTGDVDFPRLRKLSSEASVNLHMDQVDNVLSASHHNTRASKTNHGHLSPRTDVPAAREHVPITCGTNSTPSQATKPLAYSPSAPKRSTSNFERSPHHSLAQTSNGKGSWSTLKYGSPEERSVLLFSRDSDSDSEYEGDTASSIALSFSSTPTFTGSRKGDGTRATKPSRTGTSRDIPGGTEQDTPSNGRNFMATKGVPAYPTSDVSARSNTHAGVRDGAANTRKSYGFLVENARAVALPPARKPSQIQTVRQEGQRHQMTKRGLEKARQFSQSSSSGQLTPPMSPASTGVYFRPTSSIEETGISKRMLPTMNEEEELLTALPRRQNKLADYSLQQGSRDHSEGFNIKRHWPSELDALPEEGGLEGVSPALRRSIRNDRDDMSSGTRLQPPIRTATAQRSASVRLSSARNSLSVRGPERQRSASSRATTPPSHSSNQGKASGKSRRSSLQLSPNGPPPSTSLPEVPEDSWRQSGTPSAAGGRLSAQIQHEIPLYLDEGEPVPEFGDEDDFDSNEPGSTEIFTPDEMLDVPWPHQPRPISNNAKASITSNPQYFSQHSARNLHVARNEEHNAADAIGIPRPDSPVSPHDFNFPSLKSSRLPNRARLSAVGRSPVRSTDRQR